MHIQKTHAPHRSRRLPAVEWIADQDKFQRVIVHLVERRCGRKASGELTERMRVAEEACKERIPLLLKSIKKLSAEYIACSGGDGTRVHFSAFRNRLHLRFQPITSRRLSIELRKLDREIILLRRGIAGILASVLYLSMLVGMTSAETAQEIGGISPSFVRQVGHRARFAAKSLGYA